MTQLAAADLGVTCSTTIATAGFLLATGHPVPRAVAVLQIVRALAGVSAAVHAIRSG